MNVYELVSNKKPFLLQNIVEFMTSLTSWLLENNKGQQVPGEDILHE